VKSSAQSCFTAWNSALLQEIAAQVAND